MIGLENFEPGIFNIIREYSNENIVLDSNRNIIDIQHCCSHCDKIDIDYKDIFDKKLSNYFNFEIFHNKLKMLGSNYLCSQCFSIHYIDNIHYFDFFSIHSIRFYAYPVKNTNYAIKNTNYEWEENNLLMKRLKKETREIKNMSRYRDYKFDIEGVVLIYNYIQDELKKINRREAKLNEKRRKLLLKFQENIDDKLNKKIEKQLKKQTKNSKKRRREIYRKY